MAFFKSQTHKILQWQQDNSVLLHRFAKADFDINFGSQLVVMERQVAVFVWENQIADFFATGEYKLDGKNLPILSSIAKVNKKEQSIKGNVYFLNTNKISGLRWQTQSSIFIRDRDFGLIKIKASGYFSFQVADVTRFLIRTYSEKTEFTVGDILTPLTSILMDGLKLTIAKYSFGAKQIASNYRELSNLVAKSVSEFFSDSGLELSEFAVDTVEFPQYVDHAIYKEIKEKKLTDYCGGYSRQKEFEKSNKTAVKQEEKPERKRAFADPNKPTNPRNNPKSRETLKIVETQVECHSCGAKLNKNAKFCNKCGEKQAIGANTCPNCQIQIEPYASFCSNCGNKI